MINKRTQNTGESKTGSEIWGKAKSFEENRWGLGYKTGIREKNATSGEQEKHQRGESLDQQGKKLRVGESKR